MNKVSCSIVYTVVDTVRFINSYWTHLCRCKHFQTMSISLGAGIISRNIFVEDVDGPCTICDILMLTDNESSTYLSAIRENFQPPSCFSWRVLRQLEANTMADVLQKLWAV